MSIPEIWEEFLKNQEQQLGKRAVSQWIRPLRLRRFDAGNLYLEATDSFQVLWFEEHVRNKLQAELRNKNGRPIKVHLVTESPQQQAAASDGDTGSNSKRKPAARKESAPAVRAGDGLAVDALLERLVSHPGIEIALRLLTEVATGIPAEGADPIGEFNPIYVYGPTGSGKSMLLMSVARAMQERGISAVYCKADTFTEHVIAAIRAGEMRQFRQAYRNAGALLLDDVQIFSRKTSTQEELFHTFNTLHLEGKQIILASNCPPSELSAIEPRLVSRFEWGLSLPIKPPEGVYLQALIKARAAAMNWQISERMVEWLVDTFPSGVNAVVKACETLALRAHMEHYSLQHLSTERALGLIKDLIIEEAHASITSEKIIQAVADHFGMPIEELLSDSQTRECVIPRQLAMYICRQKLKMPYMRIGDLFKRDHSTVMSAIKACQKGLEDPSGDLARHHSASLKRLALLRR